MKDESLAIVMPPYFRTKSKFFYLSGISKTKTINCNENGYFSYFKSDRFGFNNIDEEWDREEIEFVLLGDSMVLGNCVNRPNDIASIFRKLSNYKGVLSLGYPGIGTLTEYAILKEYLPKKVKNIVWVLHDNDFSDLTQEVKNQKLYEYATSSINFKNNLRNDQQEIDTELKKNITGVVKKAEEYYFYWENYYSTKKQILRFIRLDRLKRFYNYLSKSNISKNENKENLNTLIEFKRLASLIKNLALENDSRLYFVYIADHNNYNSYLNRKFNLRNSTSIQKEMVEIVKNLNITVINIHEDFFQKEKDPLKYYPFRKRGHYNELGYKKVAEFIYGKIIN